ncbi:MAG: hypothetical protein IJF34_07490 [Clostridia bacterium]|nr:hypothetical protein [Clostridia bacterium]MBQ4623656.1 hypothetical protein [Clostridia bacterium]
MIPAILFFLIFFSLAVWMMVRWFRGKKTRDILIGIGLGVVSFFMAFWVAWEVIYLLLD